MQPVSQAMGRWEEVAVKVIIGKRKLTGAELKNLALARLTKKTREQ